MTSTPNASKSGTVRNVVRGLVSALLACGIAVWLGLSLLSLLTYADEGVQPHESLLRILFGGAVLLLGVAAMVLALRLLWVAYAPRPLSSVVLALGLTQLVVFAWALSLSSLVRSGLAWDNTTWRRVLKDMLLIELYAYYHMLGVFTFLVIAAVIAVAIVRLVYPGTSARGWDAGLAVGGRQQ